MNSVLVASSVFASDFSRLSDEVRRAEDGGTDWFHLDVMDGNFVDNISFGPEFVNATRRNTGLPIDVHLMIRRPDHYFPRFARAANNITVHVEVEHDVRATLAGIRGAGCTAGLALNPATPFSAVEPFLDRLDLLLVMTVHPGFSGQAFRSEMMNKVRAAAAVRKLRGLSFRIQVDGGINPETAKLSIDAGAEVLVAGTSVFGQKNIAAAIEALRPSDFKDRANT
jgi:ribulose-phosphate 3-epimerase